MTTIDQQKEYDVLSQAFRDTPAYAKALATALDNKSEDSFYPTALGTMVRAIDSGMNLTLLIEHASKMLELVKEYRKPTL